MLRGVFAIEVVGGSTKIALRFCGYCCSRPEHSSGVEPPKPEEINDLRAWNTKHGAMWMVYGGIIALSAIIFSFVIDGLVGTVILIGGVMLPLPFMVWWHHHLESKYLKK